LPRINILIHAAGAIRRARQENAQKVESVLALHMLAPIALTRLLAEPLRRAGSAWVINPVTALHQFYPYDLNDLQSRNRYEPTEVLARTHAGLVALTGALAVGMTGTGVNIAAVALEQVRTPLLLRLEGPLTGSVVEQHIAKIRREQQRAAMDTPAHAARQIVEVMLARQFADSHGCLIEGGRVAGPILTQGTDLDRLQALWTTSAALSGLPE
jgi:NAD(P)-dependent dehydrogenase (short-subunit alcohol dehydrogenase family)